MDHLENQETPYFTESEGVEKLGVRVRISWKIRGHVVGSEGMVIRMFRVTDAGFSVLIKCVTAEGETVSQLFNKRGYESWVNELPGTAADVRPGANNTPLYKLLTRWPFIK
ncbi:hypothetical protein A3H65_00315 [Candidatus Giovannonibacteria bacterium RIFCSPLOWO2_02_FULL_45_14]|uniref:Uncharacterized protein n=2 Tax=Parcubacteria group TaxID=1794811 RepID=A0A0H4TPB1_9BACT|nr:hypothetical protein [uncultured Parcubacteria bacterium Rifle_16ft_4_minimus_37658]OGF69275.1 MAG: hypothetical protein A3C75_03755 [Candidatus Giovannonibacteria bacterium RIFCSPHIGHO2_02_FULL_44_31]OGF76264.1 MAG: hypothetical protein A3E62_03990 [Candidatus Giovannonibacteria bacterium RIFCSPHIGHO2_12_FULL_44_29]OGF91158.1 MAG: hypothetical protein A3H65_00315 [Candidatus Giovannonibacteria bacterium RIFCSPLOWO2_02_FULL_45_14]OGF93617.1 MAG: hypothetical protein A3G54_03485 [Candidatus G